MGSLRKSISLLPSSILLFLATRRHHHSLPSSSTANMHYSTLTLCISLLAMASPILSAPASPMVSGCEGYAPCRRISHLFRNERKIFFVSGSSKPSIKNHLPNSLSMPPPPQGLHPPNSASNSQRHSSPDASPGTIKKSPPSSSFADGVMPAELSLGKIRCPYGPPDQGQRQTFSYRYTYTTTLRETHVDSVILGIVMLLAVAVILIGLMDVICLV